MIIMFLLVDNKPFMIFKLFLNDLNEILSEIYEKNIENEDNKKKPLECCYRKCNSVQQKEE